MKKETNILIGILFIFAFGILIGLNSSGYWALLWYPSIFILGWYIANIYKKKLLKKEK